MNELPWIVSVDDHVIEPAHLWQQWLPRALQQRGPRIERRRVASLSFGNQADFQVARDDADGQEADVWVFENLAVPHKRMTAGAGFPLDERDLTPITYERMRPGCYDPKARLADMDINWTQASLCFPTFPRFCGQTFSEAHDKDLALACVRAYNDWMVEEWCGDSGGRLVPLCLIPLWDVELAAAEVLRNAARGVRAVTFSEIPPKLGLPSIHSGYWEPFFSACERTGTVVCMHIGSSTYMPYTSTDAPTPVSVALTFNNAMMSLIDYLFSGVLVRHPGLRLAYSEGQIGWIPYVLERVDDVWKNHAAWSDARALTPEPPSTYFHRQVYGCFFRDEHGLESIHRIGIDNITFESDYPHTDGTWPHTKTEAEQMMANLDDDAVHKIVRGNAIRMFDLSLPEAPLHTRQPTSGR
jgi:predicted TIM-barrel fold metal-dependent hydrolase